MMITWNNIAQSVYRERLVAALGRVLRCVAGEGGWTDPPPPPPRPWRSPQLVANPVMITRSPWCLYFGHAGYTARLDRDANDSLRFDIIKPGLASVTVHAFDAGNVLVLNQDGKSNGVVLHEYYSDAAFGLRDQEQGPGGVQTLKEYTEDRQAVEDELKPEGCTCMWGTGGRLFDRPSCPVHRESDQQVHIEAQALIREYKDLMRRRDELIADGVSPLELTIPIIPLTIVEAPDCSEFPDTPCEDVDTCRTIGHCMLVSDG